MRSNESKALEAIARMYEAAPKYLLGAKGKDELERALIEAIDALDIVEYGRTKKTFLGSIQNEVPYRRKRTILSLVEERHLTPREGHVLRYLANGHNPSYIADKLGISLTTLPLTQMLSKKPVLVSSSLPRERIPYSIKTG